MALPLSVADGEEARRRGGCSRYVAAGCFEPLQAPASLRAEEDAASNDGVTPLHYAAWKGHLEAVELLLARGARREATSATGATALMFASCALVSTESPGCNAISGSTFALDLARLMTGHPKGGPPRPWQARRAYALSAQARPSRRRAREGKGSWQAGRA